MGAFQSPMTARMQRLWWSMPAAWAGNRAGKEMQTRCAGCMVCVHMGTLAHGGAATGPGQELEGVHAAQGPAVWHAQWRPCGALCGVAPSTQ